MKSNQWKIAAVAALVALSPAAVAQAESAESEPSQEARPESSGQSTPLEAPQTETLPRSARLGIWFQRAAEAYAAEDHAEWVKALENLHELRPFNYDIMRQLVMGYALIDQKPKAFNMMLSMQQQGLAVDWDAIDEVESLRQYQLYEHLRDLMQGAAEPAGNAEILWEIPSDYPMPEAVARDSATGRLFVGTVRDGAILVRGSEDDGFEVFAEPENTPGLNAVLALLVDEQRGHLWVATGSTGQFRGARSSNSGRTALLKLDLESGDKLAEYRVLPDGQPHLLGAMTQASDGTIYATDGASPLIYRLKPGDERPEPLVGNPNFSSLRGIALSKDEQRLYIADYEMGLFFFNLTDPPEGFALGIPPGLNLGGVDGLYRWQDHLIVIQNGVTPQRILRLELDDSGRRVANIATIAKALPEFDNPTFGTIAEDDLFFFGASHWHHVDNAGRPVGSGLEPVPLMRAPVDEAEAIATGEEMMKSFGPGGPPMR